MRSVKSLNEIATAHGIPDWKIQQGMKIANQRRIDHWHARKGWSYNKGKTMLSTSAMPMWMYLDPDIRKEYFPEGADPKQRAKLAEKFCRDYPQFRST